MIITQRGDAVRYGCQIIRVTKYVHRYNGARMLSDAEMAGRESDYDWVEVEPTPALMAELADRKAWRDRQPVYKTWAQEYDAREMWLLPGAGPG